MLPVIVSGIGAGWMVATSLYSLPLTEGIAQHLAGHFWMLGLAASLGGFLPVTAVWIVGLRLWRRHGTRRTG